jgi:hypothetical protein
MIYIANTTKQNWNHHFRVLESNRPFFVQIPSGSQVSVGQSWSAAQTESVVGQLEKFGARQANETSRKLDRFTGLLYPISENQIVSGHDAVVENQERRSAAEATKSALGFDAATRDKRTKKRLASVTEVTVKQDTPRNEKPSGNEVNFSVAVTEDGRDTVKLN